MTPRAHHRAGWFKILLACALSWSMLIIGSQRAAAVKATAPNIVIVLTDDQRFDSLFSMRHVRGALAGKGSPSIAPSCRTPCVAPRVPRSSRGGLSHTTQVYTNVYRRWTPYGGWRAFHLAHDEQGTIALALHDAGYRTGIFGKYFNGFPGVVEPGWDQMGVFQEIAHGRALLPLFPLREERSGDAHRTSRTAKKDYSTQVIADKAMGFLRGTAPGHPFFLYVAPFAPHAAIVPAPRDIGSWGPTTGLIFGRASTRATSRGQTSLHPGTTEGRQAAVRTTVAGDLRVVAVRRSDGRKTDVVSRPLEAAVQHDDRLHVGQRRPVR